MTAAKEDGQIRLEPGRIARIVIDAPASRNAMTAAMWGALPEIAARVGGDPTTRVVVLTGAGGTFCAGADIGEFAETCATPERAAQYNATVRAGIGAISAIGRPVLARIEGACFGGGVALALACDLRFADAGATLAITPARLGIAYSPADTQLVVRAVGAARARDLLYSARRVGAPEAAAIGLIDRLCPAGTLDAEIADYAEGLAQLSPASIAQAKATIEALTAGRTDPAIAAGFEALFVGPEFAEGRAAFLGRRPPRF
ncbi:MAG: enoyl-CoA hydratase/isomerase family protein [Gemmobacter sp.]